MPKKSDSSNEKPEILDLLDDAKKLSRRERKRQEIEPPPPPVPDLPSALDVAKREALDLYAEDLDRQHQRKLAAVTMTGDGEGI